MRFLTCGILTFAAILIGAAAPAAEFPLKEGDVWVMAGDSITAQHLHSNYFEAFCYARYPKLKFAFRNSGVGGHTIPTTLARFDYDIAAWKPTVVSVELGMNDSGGTPTAKFIENMGTMVERIRKSGARPIILSASPVNDGTTMEKLAGRNATLSDYARALKEFSDKDKIPYADQFHALVDVWGKNKPREGQAGAFAAVRILAANNSLEGVEHLRAFLKAQEGQPQPITMQGDAVHPGPTGQLMMAAALLKALGAEPFVSSVAIDATAGSGTAGVTAKGCTVTSLKEEAGGLSFDRLDECLPFPVADGARAVLPLAPDVLDLSRYTLTVTNLKPGTYTVNIKGVPCAAVTEKELAAGINLTSLLPEAINPINAQSQAVLQAVEAKEGIVSQWRGVSQRAHAPNAAPELKETLAEMTRRVEEADAKIRDAAKPQKLHFEIVPRK